MKKLFLYSVGAFIFLSGCSTTDYARDEHEETALQELERAVRSAEKGDAAGIISHTGIAKKHLIEENKEHPYTHPFISVYGQFPKAEHDIEMFEEMDKAIGEAKKGNLAKAGEAARRASMHLQQRARSK
ncbi:small metal-binding protein SmbP [Nitrosovibrio sp. Nv6]|uniref:small metal-binding protein SmbP n=1 Tax=Nitrosovibrio sp. Nv6 TaxID=1855340 RepID=UPI0008BE93AD|nr:small metal-binding protein SmbP [Nitrosovibrio sp. Nv6]SEO45995.1 Small metal-binding protein [Nitrosovibrio sp. Nv6]